MRKLKLEELNRDTLDEFKSRIKNPIVIVLDNIRSAMNVGSFFRTADAFACERIVITGFTPQPPHREINKTAIGADTSMEWSFISEVEVALDQLKNEGYTIIGIEQTDKSVSFAEIRQQGYKKVAIVFGNEVNGLSEVCLPLLDEVYDIPQYGTKHSLNVATCGGIVLWEFLQNMTRSNH